MGVNGLWQVLQPCARPTNLATLNRKRLAVDASIWIYQFLKAVRDKEGDALRNSHVVGFFRRICKLLWHGIRPVFVFDGGAPALKRATLQGRRRRREGRREDATRTANKLLAVQMQRLAQEEAAKLARQQRKRDRDAGKVAAEPTGAGEDGVAEGEVIPTGDDLVYADEQLLTKTERQKARGKFHKKDAYHLPELDKSMHEMGRPNDPRVMSIDELEEYARQFHRGEDINLYDFSKIDFDGDFFKSLPSADRYNILNAARIRSRLRMGLSKEQLDRMFPDRRAFSRFQVERVQERNRLTQRLMLEMGMVGSTDLTVGGRINSERGREYILVKNEGAEGGWALGVVTREKDKGEEHNPIDVDAPSRTAGWDEDEEWEDEDEDFEDVPIEGLNRLPKVRAANREEESMFVDQEDLSDEAMFMDRMDANETLMADEEEDINRAIALSLKNQHDVEIDGTMGGGDDGTGNSGGGFEHSEDPLPPEWTQKAVEARKPITKSSGRMIAHMVNNRAGRIVPRPRKPEATSGKEGSDNSDSSDSDVDLQTALAAARRKRQRVAATQPQAPPQSSITNLFGGPLPFEKLDWRSSSVLGQRPPFASRTEGGKEGGSSSSAHMAATSKGPGASASAGAFQVDLEDDDGDDDGIAGGFLTRPAPEADAPRPLPPWLMDNNSDIRESIQNQRQAEADINAQDRELVLEEQRRFRREMRDQVVEIESSSEDGNDSDIEIIEAPPPRPAPQPKEPSPWLEATMGDAEPTSSRSRGKSPSPALIEMEVGPGAQAALKASSAPDEENLPPPSCGPALSIPKPRLPETPEAARPASPSPEVEFEDVEILERTAQEEPAASAAVQDAEDEDEDMEFEDVPPPATTTVIPDLEEEFAEATKDVDDDDLPRGPEAAFDNAVDADAPEAAEFDEFSDSEDEELLAQMAAEAEEHARFASTLNNKSAQENQASYEQELRQLRAQQKKDRRDADEVTQIMVTECQALLRLFGIPYVTAPMEAEAQCAELVHLGLVDGIVTDDSDTFLFGGTRVYKNMFNGNKFVECYVASDLEKELSLSRENLIALAQLLGSDYADGLPGVGPVTAVEILSEFPGPEGLLRFRDWWRDVQSFEGPSVSKAAAEETSTFRRKFRRSQGKRLFLAPGFPSPAVPEAYLHPEVDSDPQPFQWGVPDLSGLRSFLMSTIGWSAERTDEVLVPVIRDMNKREVEGTQSNITRFFSGGVGVGAAPASTTASATANKEASAPTVRRSGQGSRRMADAVSKLRAGTDAEKERRRGVKGRVRGRGRADAAEDNGEEAEEEEEEEEGGGEGEEAETTPRVTASTAVRKRKARGSLIAGGGGNGVWNGDGDGNGEDEVDDDFVPESGGGGGGGGGGGRGNGGRKRGKGTSALS